MPYQYKREPLLPDEINRLANACKTADERICVWTLLDTGLRVSEFTGLTRDNIDWQGQRLIIHGKGGPFGTKGKRRVVPMTDRIRPLLEHYFALNESMHLKDRTVQRLVKRIANRAHISKNITPHVLRHTFAVTTVQKGVSLPALQKILGHDRLTTTEIYLNLSPEEALREFQEKW